MPFDIVLNTSASRSQDPAQDAFVAAFLDFVAGLDMQIPTLFLGDFNGTVCPDRYYSSGLAGVSSLLTRLLGPGGPLVDL